MKLIFRILLGFVTLTLIFVVVFVSSYYIGYEIAAAPMEELRSSIQVGMSRSEVVAIMEQYDGVSDYGSSSIMQVSQASSNFTSPIVGSWFCFFKVRLVEDKVDSIDDIYCVD